MGGGTACLRFYSPHPLLQKDVKKYSFFLHTNRFSVVYKSSEGRGPCPPAPHPLSRGRGGAGVHKGPLYICKSFCTSRSIQQEFQGNSVFLYCNWLLVGRNWTCPVGGGWNSACKISLPPPLLQGGYVEQIEGFSYIKT